jgi:hypothetical protein
LRMLQKQVHIIFLAALFYNCFATEATCPPGAVLSPFDPNVCYLFSANATDYYAAADFCENAGGHLTSVHGAFENNYFRGAASSSDIGTFWIGGSNVNLNGTWNWEDRSPFDWTDWAPGQPNRTAGLCLYVSQHNGYWYGDGCTQAKPFMCKINPAKQGLASCPNGWSFFSETKNCYKALKNIPQLTCALAFQKCSDLGATVASIHSFSENSFISGMISTTSQSNYSVIGLIADKFEWRWQDNTLLNYTRWSSAVPVVNGSCLVLADLSRSVNWYSYNSYYSYATEVVCELNGYENSRKAARDSSCPKGTFESPDNSICYKVYSDASNWYAAEQTCLKGNGHLVSVHNSDVNSFLLGVVPFNVPGAVDFWIGGFSNSTWKWSDSTPFDFINWAPGNPLSDAGLCVSEKVRSGYWYSTKCDATKPFICTVPLGAIPRPSCPPNFSYYDVTNKCYQVVQVNTPIKSCEYAKDVCFNLTAKVASIHSDEENFFIGGLAMINSTSTTTYTAIGLVGDGFHWNWLDGSVLDYTFFYGTYLPKANDCALMSTSLYGSYNARPLYWSTLSSSYGYNQVVCQVTAN